MPKMDSAKDLEYDSGYLCHDLLKCGSHKDRLQETKTKQQQKLSLN